MINLLDYFYKKGHPDFGSRKYTMKLYIEMWVKSKDFYSSWSNSFYD